MIWRLLAIAAWTVLTVAWVAPVTLAWGLAALPYWVVAGRTLPFPERAISGGRFMDRLLSRAGML